MNPLSFNDLEAQPDMMQRPLFVNKRLATVQWIRHLLAYGGGANLGTLRRNLTLPTELWLMILSFAEAEAVKDPVYYFVSPSLAPSPASDELKVICCAPVEFDLSGYLVSNQVKFHFSRKFENDLDDWDFWLSHAIKQNEAFLLHATPTEAVKLREWMSKAKYRLDNGQTHPCLPPNERSELARVSRRVEGVFYTLHWKDAADEELSGLYSCPEMSMNPRLSIFCHLLRGWVAARLDTMLMIAGDHSGQSVPPGGRGWMVLL